MLLHLRRTGSEAELEPLLALARELGYRARFLDVTRRVLELESESAQPGDPGHRSRFEDLAVVAQVLSADDAPELAESTPGRRETVVGVRDAVVGGGSLALIAGPCAVEDEDDLLVIAREVHAAGATLLRGGAFKPRSSPHSFRGLGGDGLRLLAAVRAEVPLGIVTEVLDPRDVEAVAAVADVLQIGARSMSNSALLLEAGRTGRPVLLKRGLAATVREFLLASEYVLSTGNPNVILCERGVRGFDKTTRGLLDVGAIAHLARATHLPVMADPSHAAGRSDLVPALAKAGLAAGADGLVVEVHPEPARVHSDGAQAITPAVFHELAAWVREFVRLEGKELSLPTDSTETDRPPLLEVEESRS